MITISVNFVNIRYPRRFILKVGRFFNDFQSIALGVFTGG